MTRAPSICLVLLIAAAARADDWPQFRGPDGQGRSSERKLPLVWSETQNISWKTAIPGRGWSSPVVLDRRIWLTAAADNGRSLRAVSVDCAGRVLLDVDVVRVDDPGTINSKNSHASPTPVLEGDRIYVHFGAYGTACLSSVGKVIWKRRFEYEQANGPGGSPIILGDLLILSCDGSNVQFVVAVDKATGDVRWKAPRSGPPAYSTPLAIRVAGVDQVVSAGGNRVSAYEPRTGKELWWSSYDGFSVVPRPLYGHGLVYVCTGHGNPALLALRPEGGGDLTKAGPAEARIVWSHQRAVPHVSSPLLVGDEIYFMNGAGIATCLDARDGKAHWQARIGGAHSASPISADGRIYFLDEDGLATVIAPGKELRKLAENRLEGRTLASPAVSGGGIYLRSETHLYRIEENSSNRNGKDQP